MLSTPVSSEQSVRRGLNPDYVPTDYTDLYEHYYEYITKLVRNARIYPDNIEDVSMSILEKFIENDVLHDFDPTYTTEYEGATRKAMFRTFLSGFVRLYLRHYIDRQRVKLQREPLSTNLPVTTGFGEASFTREWLDIFGPTTTDTYDSLYTEDLIQTLRGQLEGASNPAWVKCSLVDLYDAVILQVRANGKPNALELARTLGVSKHTVGDRMKSLKAAITEALA